MHSPVIVLQLCTTVLVAAKAFANQYITLRTLFELRCEVQV